jgi:pimeloyl-ACP methyl ester carboxylesterase
MENRIEIRPGRTINLRVIQHPTSDKTAFLIHGLGGRGEQWRFQLDLLKQDYTLIIPDLYGNGKSDKPKPDNNTYTFTEFDKDISVLFNKYASNDNIVMGHSYGGTFATSLTIKNQNKISKLILIAPVPCAPSLSLPLMYRLPAPLLQLFRPLLEKEFQKAAFDPSTNPELVAEEMRANLTNPMYVISAMVAGMKDIPTTDATTLTTPTLMLTGQHDQLIPPSVSTDYYRALPHHEFHSIDHAAHLIQLEQPAATNDLLRRFTTK